MRRLIIIKGCWFFFQLAAAFAGPPQDARTATPVPYPSISFDEIQAFANRPVGSVYDYSVYEWRSLQYYWDDTSPVIQLSTDDLKMFFTRFVPNIDTLPREQIPPFKAKDENYLKLKAEGVIITKQNHCFFWRVGLMRNLTLWDDGTNYFNLYVTNDWTPTIVRERKKEKLQLPSSKNILLCWNRVRFPSALNSRITQVNVKKDEILSLLDQNKTNRFVTRFDALGSGGTFKRDGGFLSKDNKIIFWELTADDKLFLEDEQGASCLLEK